MCGSRSPWAGSAGQNTHPTELVLPLLEEEEVDWKGPGQLGLSDGSTLEDVKVFFCNWQTDFVVTLLVWAWGKGRHTWLSLPPPRPVTSPPFFVPKALHSSLV